MKKIEAAIQKRSVWSGRKGKNGGKGEEDNLGEESISMIGQGERTKQSWSRETISDQNAGTDGNGLNSSLELLRLVILDQQTGAIKYVSNRNCPYTFRPFTGSCPAWNFEDVTKSI